MARNPSMTVTDERNAGGAGVFDVAVVGAGIGGLSAAALLARRGFKVVVCERHHQAGGNCTSWTRKVPIGGAEGTFVFDCGVQDISGLGPNGPLGRLLREIGAGDRIAWKRVTHLYWKDGIRIEAGGNCADFIANLKRQFPSECGGIDGFFRDMQDCYRGIYADDAAGAHRSLRAREALRQPFENVLAKYFSNADLRAVLSLISEYITEDARRPLLEEMAPLFGYHFNGGFYPGGGSQALPRVLAEAVERHGGTIRTGTRVDAIRIVDGRAAGIVTSGGETISAPVAVADGDIVTGLTRLIPSDALPKRYGHRVAHMARGPSAVVVSVGLSTVMPLPARIFIRNEGQTLGIGNPSVLDAALAPQGHSAVTILLLLSDAEAATWLTMADGDYQRRKESSAEHLFAAIESSVFPDFRKHVVYREVATPKTFAAFTGAAGGNIYGAACAAWRPRGQTPIRGLFAVGGGTETGPGIEAVTLSGCRVADLISGAKPRAD